MNINSTSDVAEEAGNADSHVRRVTPVHSEGTQSAEHETSHNDSCS